MNRSKRKGTAFESGFVRWWAQRTGDDRVHRLALHGAEDQGDVGGIWSHGCRGVAECKDHADWGPADLARWQAEAAAECENANAEFALLVVHRRGCDASGRSPSFGRNRCFVRVRDLPRLHLGLALRAWPGTDVDEISESTWVEMTVSDAADMAVAEGEEIV